METKKDYEDAIKKIREAFYSSICDELALEQIAVNLDFLSSLINEHFEEKSETNLEHYFDELLKVGNRFTFMTGKIESCDSVMCRKCVFNGDCGAKRFKWLASSYVKPTYKLTQFEYDLLSVHKDFKTYNQISNQIHLFKMREKGYFKDIDTNIPIREILDNCEVIK